MAPRNASPGTIARRITLARNKESALAEAIGSLQKLQKSATQSRELLTTSADGSNKKRSGTTLGSMPKKISAGQRRRSPRKVRPVWHLFYY